MSIKKKILLGLGLGVVLVIVIGVLDPTPRAARAARRPILLQRAIPARWQRRAG